MVNSSVLYSSPVIQVPTQLLVKTKTGYIYKPTLLKNGSIGQYNNKKAIIIKNGPGPIKILDKGKETGLSA